MRSNVHFLLLFLLLALFVSSLAAAETNELVDLAEAYEYQASRGYYAEAVSLATRQLELATSLYPEPHPEIARAEGELPGGPHCGELAVSVPQIQFTNLAAASWMLNAFFAYSCGRLAYQEVKFDILEARALPHFPLKPGEIPEPLPSPHSGGGLQHG